MIRKADQHGFTECFGIELVDSFVDVEPFSLGDVNELLENLSYLLGYGIANAKAPSFICAFSLRVKPGAYYNKELVFDFFAEQQCLFLPLRYVLHRTSQCPHS